MREFTILALGGDGIGPEVLACGLQVAEAIANRESIKLNIVEDDLHGAAWDRYGTFCREETIEAAKAVSEEDAAVADDAGDGGLGEVANSVARATTAVFSAHGPLVPLGVRALAYLPRARH